VIRHRSDTCIKSSTRMLQLKMKMVRFVDLMEL
jgi:hypothetical protein